MTKNKGTKEQNIFVETLEKRIVDLEKLVNNILLPRLEALETRENTTDTKLDKLIAEKMENTLIDKAEKFTCKECKETFTKKTKLNHHIRERHPKNFKCNECEEIFDTRYKLENHLMEHSDKKDWKCDLCKQQFVLKWRLERHLSGFGPTKSEMLLLF